MAFKNQHGQSQLDTGLGLIFRLNDLWRDVIYKVKTADYLGWETHLDMIYENLLYGEDLEIEEDDEGNIIDVRLSEKDQKIRKFIKRKLAECNKKFAEGRKNKNFLKMKLAQKERYETLILYGASLRKKMQELGLYLKVSDGDPSKSMWGG